jgi:PIN domain nuclease of toxin-antitoxin system
VKLLLDTHIVLWVASDPQRISWAQTEAMLLVTVDDIVLQYNVSGIVGNSV